MLSEFLHERLDTMGLTPYAVAKQTGLWPSTITKYARGESPASTMPLGTAVKIAKVLGCTAEDIYNSDIIDGIPRMKNGWNTIDDHLSILVEDGKLIRGIKDDTTVYPFVANPNGGYDRADKLPSEEFAKVRWL